MTFGQLPYDVAHLLGGGVLMISFVLLYQRRIAAVSRLRKLLPLLASDQDGEVIGAARAIGRTLKGCGSDFHALALVLPVAFLWLLDTVTPTAMPTITSTMTVTTPPMTFTTTTFEFEPRR